jgi:hypothetical protein
MIDDLRPLPVKGILHPALLLAGLTLALALVLLPFALRRTDSGGVLGLAIAAAICLVAGWISEAVAWALARRVAPLGAILLGMAIRMLPPLAVCVYLAASRGGGRQHLAFIAYLLVFYLATLALETVLAVKRAAQLPPKSNLGAH